jgi:hypothetical protein
MGVHVSSRVWIAHPGDYLIVEQVDANTLRVVARSANELEAEQLMKTFDTTGRAISVLQLKGILP